MGSPIHRETGGDDLMTYQASNNPNTWPYAGAQHAQEPIDAEVVELPQTHRAHPRIPVPPHAETVAAQRTQPEYPSPMATADQPEPDYTATVQETAASDVHNTTLPGLDTPASAFERINTPNTLPLATRPLADPHHWAPLVWCVGAHGGAGTTYFAHALAPAGDAGHQWPIYDESPLCVVVANATRVGVERAHMAILQALGDRDNPCQVLGVVLVHTQPGKMPKNASQKIDILRQVTPEIWQVPFSEAWRDHLPEELPVWSPLDPQPEEQPRRRRKKIDATTQVPPEVIAIGKDIVDRARRALTER